MVDLQLIADGVESFKGIVKLVAEINFMAHVME